MAGETARGAEHSITPGVLGMYHGRPVILAAPGVR
jgi:hypothetical protein